MTGFRASTLRKTCKHCKTTFKPKRADAEFCCGLCRQAAHHRRNKAVSAARAVDVFAKRYKEGLEAIDQFDRYQSLAGTLHVKARDLNINIRYMAVRGVGILAADAGEGWGAFMFAKKKLLPPWWRPIQTVRSDKQSRARHMRRCFRSWGRLSGRVMARPRSIFLIFADV